MPQRGTAIAVALVLVVALSGPALAADLQLGPGDDLAQAIARAAPGDRLVLGPGTYTGPVVIDKPLALEGTFGAVIDNGGAGTVLKILAPDVSVRGLTIRNSGTKGENFDSGVYIEQGADHVTVEDNRLEGNLFGIVLHGSKFATVATTTSLIAAIFGQTTAATASTSGTTPARSSTAIPSPADATESTLRSATATSFAPTGFEGLRFAVHYMYANRQRNHRQRLHPQPRRLRADVLQEA